MKRILAIVLAAMMVCTLCVTAFADPAPMTGHTFKAYQIFTGTQNATDPDLTEVEWGNGVRSDGLLAALKNSEEFGTPNPFASCDSAYSVACVLDTWEDGSDLAKAFAKIAYKYVDGDGIAVENGQTEIDAGYYLIVDETEDAEVYNLALLQQTQKGTFAIASKVEVPEVEKKIASALICENTAAGHVHTKACYSWADDNKAAIGDTVLFNVDGTVPACAAEYDYYYYILGDTMSDGLTFTEGSIKVTIDGEAATEGTDYSVRFDEETNSFRIALVDAKGHAGEAVEVMYAAVLNEDAIIGAEGNPNEVTVTYSNKPNYDYDGTQLPPDDDEPGFPKPDEEDKIPTGETPKDITLTFTTAVKLYKVDQDGNPLDGAQFTLEGEGLNIVLVSKDVFTVKEGGEYWKLANGSYTKEAPIENSYMDPASASAEKGYVKAENGFDGDVVIIEGIAYRAYNASTDAGKEVFVLVKSNVEKYDSIKTKYEKSVELVEQKTATDEKVSAYVDDLGIVIFQGLNAGDYTLSETVVPDGYNPIDPITFSISCKLPAEVVTGEEACEWSVKSDAEITYSEENNAFELTVVNQKGSVLPETGGIGTTIFYVLGAMMAVTAVVLLVAKKRFASEA